MQENKHSQFELERERSQTEGYGEFPEVSCEECGSEDLLPVVWWKDGQPEDYTGEYECRECDHVFEAEIAEKIINDFDCVPF